MTIEQIEEEIIVKDGQIEDVESIMQDDKVVGDEYMRWHDEHPFWCGQLELLKQLNKDYETK